MKTKLKVKSLSMLSAVSIGAFIAATASVSALSAPLECGVLANEIGQKLIAKGVAHYELSVVAKDDADHGKKVAGTCAGGTKKILYSKKIESVAPNVVAKEFGEVPRKIVIKTTDKNSNAHQFIGTKMELAGDPWMRTKEVWGLTFSPNFEYEIRARPESAQTDAGTQWRTTISAIRYKN